MPVTTLFLILAGLIGLFVGLLVASLFSGKESRNPKTKMPPADMVKQGFADQARLWYSPAGKKLAVEMDGDYYREFDALTQEQKKKVHKLVSHFQTWVALPQALAEPVKPAEPEPVKKSPFAYEEPEIVEKKRLLLTGMISLETCNPLSKTLNKHPLSRKSPRFLKRHGL